MRTVILFLGILFSISAQAELYKWTDENGEVVYSDEPPPQGAEQIKPPAISTTPAVKYKPKPKPKAEATATDKQDSAVNYVDFNITSPADDEAVRNNAGNIVVNLTLSPALDKAKGHYINLLVDGVVSQSNLDSLSISIENMDRGTHELQAEIRNQKGDLLKTSNTVTFHLLRYSKLLPKSR